MSAPTSSLILVQELSYRTPDGRLLFDNLNLSFGPERTALVGRNGVGKTTLLRLLADELRPAAGRVVRSGRIGVLDQAPPDGAASVAGRLGAAEGLARLARIAEGRASDDDLAGADWTLEARLEQALAEVGLDGLDLGRPASELSGGQLTRLGLARLLVEAPDMLLLDEPTNHLDAAGRDLVGGVLSRWSGGAVVVSHDRALLRTLDRTVELTSLGARVYGGGYDLYAARKTEETAAGRRELEAAGQALAAVERDVQAARERKARRDASGRRARARGDAPKMLLDARAERAEASGGRLNHLADRMRSEAAAALQAAAARLERVQDLEVGLPPSGLAAGKTVLLLEEVAFAHAGGPELFGGLCLRVTGPERLAVAGPNGSGKTTLLRLLAGELQARSGRGFLGVPAARLDQTVAVLEDDRSLLANFRRLNPDANDNVAHAALARFLFRGEAALTPAGELSGGERLRAALACLLMSTRPPQLLILDEPTNHLDLPSLEAAQQALAAYDGALVVVSHDEDFLAAVGVERRIDLRAPA